jgi:hypothetical protein
MAANTLQALIADVEGNARIDFMTSTPENWADLNMARRYSTQRLETDDSNSFPALCWNKLCDEYLLLRNWFTPDGKLSLTLNSASVQHNVTGPIGDGMCFDFRADGVINPRILYYKSVLIAASRAASLLSPSDRHSGNAQFGGLIKFISGAYTSRAEVHRWLTVNLNGIVYPPSEMSRRWVAMQTYSFMLRLGADNRKWAWEASRCLSVFGPFDDNDSAL